MNSTIKIGPSFFAKAKNDYADWRWAWVREILQNSMDAPGSNRIELSVGYAINGVDTVVTCTNNGAPMTKEVLVNKFLSIGESGKGFEGTVGGFGKAKELLCFTHQSYYIRTGEFMVRGEGGQYDLAEGLGVENGTTTQVSMTGDEVSSLTRAARKFAAYAQWDGEFFLNGEKLTCNLKKGSPRREFSWGTVYTNKSDKNLVIVRVNGIPMFTRYTDLDRCVIIEVKGKSVDVLTSNRDSLVWGYRREFDEFMTELVTNKSKALKAQNPSYTHYSGAKFKASKEIPEVKRSMTSARELVGDNTARSGVAVSAFSGVVGGSGSGVVVSGERVGVLTEQQAGTARTLEEAADLLEGLGVPRPVSVISEEFVLKNELTMKIPDYYQPDSPAFGTYSKKLARVWGRLLVELHRLFKLDAEFGIGFLFSDDNEAQYESGQFGVMYYLNPAVVVEQKGTNSKSFKKRFLLTERDRLLAIAVHEVVHGMGFSTHDESYSNRLTDVFAQVMKERKRFNWCFA